MKLTVIPALVFALASTSALANGNSNGADSPPASSLARPASKIYVNSAFENVDTSGPAVNPAVMAHRGTVTIRSANGTHAAVPAINARNAAGAGGGSVRTKRQYGPRGLNYGRPQPRPFRVPQRDAYRPYRPPQYGRPYRG